VRRGDEEDAAHIWYWLDEYGPDATVRAVLVESVNAGEKLHRRAE